MFYPLIYLKSPFCVTRGVGVDEDTWERGRSGKGRWTKASLEPMHMQRPQHPGLLDFSVEKKLENWVLGGASAMGWGWKHTAQGHDVHIHTKGWKLSPDVQSGQ